jgi:hypothetical protein
MDIQVDFDNYCKLNGIKLHKEQKELADIILRYSEQNSNFLLYPCSGKTFIFNVLDDFFSNL